MNYLNLKIIGVFNNTNKIIAIAITYIIKLEIRTLNYTRAI
jgi:hypothetical protein